MWYEMLYTDGNRGFARRRQQQSRVVSAGKDTDMVSATGGMYEQNPFRIEDDIRLPRNKDQSYFG